MSAKVQHVGFLDGLRGGAALWVLVGHAMLLTGLSFPVIGRPDLAVDLFILISGFLMTFNYIGRRDREPWGEPDTWQRFWIRRFFRIAPLYYVALVVALMLGPWLGDARHTIASIGGGSGTEDARYFDQSLTNLLMHASFLFGLSPAYHYRTALPDWSIGLEMQFYAVFPMLMLLVARFGWAVATPILALAGLAAAYLMLHFGGHFSQPAFLGLKLQIFLAGMVMAASLTAERRWLWAYAAAAAVLVLIPIGGQQSKSHALLRLALTAGFFLLLHRQALPQALQRIADGVARVLGHPFSRALGELSYGVYLIHLMVMLPVVGWLASNEPTLNTPARLGATLVATLPITYALATLAHFLLERPGIALGRSLLGRKGKTAAVERSTAA